MPIYELDGVKPEFPGDGAYWIAETAVLIGRVPLKRDTSVWFGAVLRGDNEWIELGERSQIQDNSTLHTDPGFPMVIGSNCVIGHNVLLHGCTIGENSLIGMGAIVLNGARIGANSLVGAGALVTEGKSFPDNSMILGSPARAVRTLDEKAQAMIVGAADTYVRRSRPYAKGPKRVGMVSGGGETASARPLIQPRHMPCREISERHGRAERKAGLIANAIFRVHRIVARGVETRNRHVAMIDDLRVAVGDEARRREGARMQLHAVERRDAQCPEARIDVALVGPGRLPLILLGERPGCRAAREIIVDALAGKSIETLDSLGQAGGADAQQAGRHVAAGGARHHR